ncbi:MAG: OmpA family protein, partial [Shewanella sp.]
MILGLGLTSPTHAWQDTDNDGVPDIKDACQNTAPNIAVLANGCPVEAQASAPSETVQCDINDPSTYADANCHNIATARVYFEFAVAEV